MTDSTETLTAQAEKRVPLTRGLVRNTFFNLVGWAWPVLLAFLSVPYIVLGLGNDAYGIFGIVSIVAGYLGLLNAPVAIGNVRFMAEAFGRKDWDEFRKTMVAGVMIIGALAALGAVIMFLAADALARNVFKIPVSLVDSAAVAFRIAAASFFLNGVASALTGIPAAMRRYDVLNVVNVTVGTLNTAGIILAIWLGWGLLGAVMAQLLSSVLAVVCFTAVAWLVLRKSPASGQTLVLDRLVIKRLVSFSALLFGGSVASNIGLQIDRTLIGILLGPTAVTFYTVPAKITEKIPGLMYNFALALYPLSAESLATDRLDELRRLYLDMLRILLWMSAFIATMLIILSRDLLLLWVGLEFAANSQVVLILLAASVIWRASGSVAYQACNGLGRADINLVISIGTAISLALPVAILAPRLGPSGAALGMLVGLVPINIIYDLYTQRKLLVQRSWIISSVPYIRMVLVVTGTLACATLLSVKMRGWGGFLAKACLFSLIYVGFSLAFGALQKRDIRLVTFKLTKRLRA